MRKTTWETFLNGLHISDTQQNPPPHHKKSFETHFMCTLNLRFFRGLWRDKKIFMCESEAYTMFPAIDVVHPAFYSNDEGDEAHFGFTFLFYRAGKSCRKNETINTPFFVAFSLFLFYFGYRRRSRRLLHTLVCIFASPRVIKRGSDARQCGKSRKPLRSSYYMLRVNKLFRKICLARFIAVCFSRCFLFFRWKRNENFF